MTESLNYLELEGKFVFVHKHVPKNNNHSPFLFLNPLFDEKKRSQCFYAQLARLLCEKGFPVYRFDYYGTGDSTGQLFDFLINEALKHTELLIEKILLNFPNCQINLLGLRFGADLALKMCKLSKKIFNKIILIEPINNGKRYLLEQRSRRKLFYRLNNMTDVEELIEIDGIKYEDHQGYPIHIENINFIENLNSLELNGTNQKITIVKLNTITSRKNIEKLRDSLKANNQINYYKLNCNDFWAELKPIDTKPLSNEIVQLLLNETFST